MRIVPEHERNVIILVLEPFSSKQQATRDHAPEKFAQHIDVKVGMNLLQPPTDVGPWRHVIVRTHALIGSRQSSRLIWHEHDSKISKNKFVILLDKHIGRLDVPVNNPFIVKPRYGVNQR